MTFLTARAEVVAAGFISAAGAASTGARRSAEYASTASSCADSIVDALSFLLL